METTRFPVTGQCSRCIFRMSGKLTCVAFPRGIPREIWEAQVDHTLPYHGDGGIRFVPLQRYGRRPGGVHAPRSDDLQAPPAAGLPDARDKANQSSHLAGRL